MQIYPELDIVVRIIQNIKEQQSPVAPQL